MGSPSIRYCFVVILLYLRCGNVPAKLQFFFTMSKGSFATGTMSGKLGIYVFMRRKGAQVQRSLVVPTDRKTFAQGHQRAKLENPIAVYRAISPALKGAFETKKANQSDYNAFMHANLTELPTVYFPKGVADRNGGVVMPYVVSRGTLPSLNVTASATEATAWLLGITLSGTLSNQNWGAYSTAIINGSSGLIKDGDVLTVIGLRQSIMTGQGVVIPRVTGHYASMTLDTTSEAVAASLLPSGMEWTEIDTTQLAIDWPGNSNGALAVILSRKVGDRLLTSNQSFVLAEGATVYESWITEDAANSAAASYGNTNELLLSPTKEFVEQ